MASSVKDVDEAVLGALPTAVPVWQGDGEGGGNHAVARYHLPRARPASSAEAAATGGTMPVSEIFQRMEALVGLCTSCTQLTHSLKVPTSSP